MSQQAGAHEIAALVVCALPPVKPMHAPPLAVSAAALAAGRALHGSHGICGSSITSIHNVNYTKTLLNEVHSAVGFNDRVSDLVAQWSALADHGDVCREGVDLRKRLAQV